MLDETPIHQQMLPREGSIENVEKRGRGSPNSVVELVGHVVVEESHVEYVICSSDECSSGLVQRRYREFDALAYALAPMAKADGVKLPALPSKAWRRAASRVSPAYAARRQEALKLWLAETLRRYPALWSTDAVRLFLGLRSYGDPGHIASSSSEPAAPALSVGVRTMGAPRAIVWGAVSLARRLARYVTGIPEPASHMRSLEDLTICGAGAEDDDEPTGDSARRPSRSQPAAPQSLLLDVSSAWRAMLASSAPNGIGTSIEAPATSPADALAPRSRRSTAMGEDDAVDSGLLPPLIRRPPEGGKRGHRRVISEPPPRHMLATPPVLRAPPKPVEEVSEGEGSSTARAGNSPARDGRSPSREGSSPSRGGPSTAIDAAGAYELNTTLDALGGALRLAEAFGSVFAIAKRSDEANISRVRRAVEQLTAKGHLNPADGGRVTLRAVLEAEIAAGVNTPSSGVLLEPSAAHALVWILRSLRFQMAVLQGMGEQRNANLSALARDVYPTTLEPHHGLWLRSTVRAALSAMPTREAFFGRLGGWHGVAPAVREARCYTELTELLDAQARAVSGLTELLLSLDLDDHRKA